MWIKLKKWWAIEGEMVRLSGLDNRLLADMGLERGQLRDRVQGVTTRTSPAPNRHRVAACEGC
jgi:uncharacterized protein YjiS (DUF1127 family)